MISRRNLLAAGFGAIAAAPTRAQGSHALVMVEEPGCVYCARWHAEVGPAYANSAEGRFAPLRRVRLGATEIGHLKGLRYTPTFVLVEGGSHHNTNSVGQAQYRTALAALFGLNAGVQVVKN